MIYIIITALQFHIQFIFKKLQNKKTGLLNGLGFQILGLEPLSAILKVFAGGGSMQKFIKC